MNISSLRIAEHLEQILAQGKIVLNLILLRHKQRAGVTI